MKTVCADVSLGNELTASPMLVNHPDFETPGCTTTAPAGGLVRDKAAADTANKSIALRVQTISSTEGKHRFDASLYSQAEIED